VTIIQPGGYPTTNVMNNLDRYTGALRARADQRHTSGYPEMVARMGHEAGPGGAYAAGTPDAMDVPRAIAEIAAMPAGRRPLRRGVDANHMPAEPINKVCAETQLAMLGGSPLGPWVKAVLD